MTLCVAGFCENGRTLVVAHDTLLGYGSAVQPSSAVFKSFRFLNTWLGLFAGEVTPVEPIMNRVLAKLATSPNDLGGVVEAFTAAFQEERLKQLHNCVLAKYGLDYAAFIKTAGMPKKVWLEAQDFELGVLFLVGGFDQHGQQHLFGVYDPGRCDDYTSAGYSAIGIGAEQALHNLAFRSYRWGMLSVTAALSLVSEAKFVGEGPYVGRDTVISAIRPHEGASFFLRGDSEIRLLAKAGRLADAEQKIATLLEWAPLTP